ncbi:TetR/AcrR family transcriptional regulator [Gordonia sp. CPCC 206044]|uniref:TetR family transcriptional regulator n=1 Tax=Gordonia sp. CPCC 206044 TaxID=3140793 RepID=UPI003AF3941B
MTTGTRASSQREPQQERSRLTRERLLRATVDALAQDGWAAATVAAVAERAGVSRGAAQHHFPTREALITAALELIFDDMTASASAAPESVPDGDRVAAGVARAVAIYTGTEFKAALQVWAAAASDPALREMILPLEGKFAHAAHRMTVSALDPEGTNPQARSIAQVTLDLARGLGLADTLSDDSRRREQVVATWTLLVSAALDASNDGAPN